MRFKGLPYLVVASSLAFAQPKPAEPSFEVASIKPSPPRTTGPMVTGFNGGPGTASPTRATFMRYRLASLVSFAYDLKLYQFDYNNPRLQDEFEVAVTLPEGATKEQFHATMKSLLAERFHLAFHWEKKSTDVFDLVQAKGGNKLKSPTTPDAPPEGFTMPGKGQDNLPILPPRQSMQKCAYGGCRMQQIGVNLDPVINQLALELNAPIVDATGLSGKYDYLLSWGSSSPQATRPEDPAPPPPLATAITDQLALRVEKRKGEIDYLVVDSVNRTPTEN